MGLSFRARAALIVMAFVGLAVVGFLALMHEPSCDGLMAKRVGPNATPLPPPHDEPTALDEERTRAEAPTLAALLDDAARGGSTKLTGERESSARTYVEQVAAEQDASAGRVAWRGETFDLLSVVC